MKLESSLLLTLVAACTGGSTPVIPSNCSPFVPANAEHTTAMAVSALAGDYQLIQVPTQPRGAKTIEGKLHLQPRDTGTNPSKPSPTVLIGWFEPVGGDSAWRAIVGSRDPKRPGAILRAQQLRIGMNMPLDGYGYGLRITAVDSTGFWGWWVVEPGLSVPVSLHGERVPPEGAGYFCALRIASEP